MTFAQLKAFHAVALEGSFQRAAERLRLTQPAISIQVRNLESDSARVLFRRKGHQVDLTDDGRDLFEQTRRLFEAESEARALLSSAGTDVPRRLHLGADGPHIALDLISAFQRRITGVRVKVTLANAESTWESLHALKVDAAIMANAKPDRQIVSRVISRQSLMALIPAGHELCHRRTLALAQLCEAPLIFREPGSNTQRIVDEAFAALSTPVQPQLVLGSREAVKEAVVRGLGIGFIFDGEIGHDTRSVGKKITGFENCNADMLLCLKDQRRNPLVAALFAAIGDLAAQTP